MSYNYATQGIFVARFHYKLWSFELFGAFFSNRIISLIFLVPMIALPGCGIGRAYSYVFNVVADTGNSNVMGGIWRFIMSLRTSICYQFLVRSLLQFDLMMGVMKVFEAERYESWVWRRSWGFSWNYSLYEQNRGTWQIGKKTFLESKIYRGVLCVIVRTRGRTAQLLLNIFWF